MDNDICYYLGMLPINNLTCMPCPDFMDTCIPIITSRDGFSSSSECSEYLCPGCNQYQCIFYSFINL